MYDYLFIVNGYHYHLNSILLLNIFKIVIIKFIVISGIFKFYLKFLFHEWNLKLL